MKNTKHLILAIVAVFLVTATVLGTIAYLTASKKVVNTFTVGDVKLDIDEAVVTPDGNPVGEERTDEGNKYHLLPGMTYTKDPTATVKAGSEACYVRMVVTFTNYAELNALRTEFDVKDFFTGIDLSKWLTDGNVTVKPDGTGTVEFYYTGSRADATTNIVPATDKDLVLEPLFTGFTVPGALNNKELAVFNNMQVSIEAQAIQAAGFGSVKEAWAAFETQHSN